MSIDAAIPMPAHAWLNGRIVPFDQCVVHARSQGAFWGANVFEGLRGYWDAERQDTAVFRLQDHLGRLSRSAKCLRLGIAWSDADLAQACMDVVVANDLRQDVHMCVVAYFDMAPNCDPMVLTANTGVHITATAAPRTPGYKDGVSACISSWRRIGDDSMPPRIKTGANYHNSRLAHHEAVRNGYGTTLLLNPQGHVAEGPGSCVVMVRDGRLVTPPATSGALEGITLETVGVLAETAVGAQLEYREIDRTELYVADEIFLCGTMCEVQPVVSVDRLAVGPGVPGPITRRLQEAFDRSVRGGARAEWCTWAQAAEYRTGQPAVGVVV
ncbi:MAG TPA: branched-chain-amino-acid transaminase [Acidimicrobiales bacterium]|nr:branched-chain-amino-acid transaminase [Acidimicrobiales bacterium]